MVELTLPIETGRLVLRAFSVADTDAYFEYQQLPEVARIDEENTGSVRVAKRLGMRREARLVESDLRDGQWGTEVVFAMLASEWRAGEGSQ